MFILNSLLQNSDERKKANRYGIVLEAAATNVNLNGLADNQMGIDISNLVMGGDVMSKVSAIWIHTNEENKKKKEELGGFLNSFHYFNY